jgi:hypothetical protein
MRGDASCLFCQQSQHLAQHRDARGPGAPTHVQSKKGCGRATIKMAIHTPARYVAQQMVLVVLIIYQGFFHDQ